MLKPTDLWRSFKTGQEIWLHQETRIYAAPPRMEVTLSMTAQRHRSLYRYDGEYDGWNLWMWAKSRADISFTEEDELDLRLTHFDDLTHVTSLTIVRKSTR